MRKFSARIGLGLALMGLASPVLSATPEETARAALSRSPIIDGHNDVPEQLRARYGNDFSKFDFHDMSPTAAQKGGKMHTDLARLKKGMVGDEDIACFNHQATTTQIAGDFTCNNGGLEIEWKNNHVLQNLLGISKFIGVCRACKNFERPPF